MPDPLYLITGDPTNFSVTYTNPAKKTELEAGWRHFNRFDPATGLTWHLWYRNSSTTSDVMADYVMPAHAQKGRYRIEVFIPGKNATTRKALFSIANNFRVENNQIMCDDSIASINMFDLFDVWVSLGEFELDPGSNPKSGRVRQFDLTMEAPATRISFGPIRWIPLFNGQPVVNGGGSPGAATNRFDIPVGTAAQRAEPIIERVPFSGHPRWLADWYDFTLFLEPYSLGYHTGADINSTISSDADANAPIFAAGDGKVLFAGRGAGTSWGNIILIEHPDGLIRLPDGSSRRQKVYTRYGHVNDQILVQKGQAVKKGDPIGFIGLMAGKTTGWHLHFDVAYGSAVGANASHWPDTQRRKELFAAGKAGSQEYNAEMVKIKQILLANYVNPLDFLKDNH